VLVTGAAGAFGTAVSAALRERGAEVAGIDLAGEATQGAHIVACDITDPEAAAAQAQEIAVRHSVTSAEGAVVAVRAGTVCVHGDNPSAVAIAQSVRAALDGAGVVVRSPAADGD